MTKAAEVIMRFLVVAFFGFLTHLFLDVVGSLKIADALPMHFVFIGFLLIGKCMGWFLVIKR